jgi:hypothetical protein
MDGLSIIAVSLGVGVVVYALSLRSSDAPLDGSAAHEAARRPLWSWRRDRPSGQELGFGDETAPVRDEEPAPEGFVYVPILASDAHGWRTRIGGVVGLLAMVAIGAVALALGAYQIGHVLNKVVEGFVGR